MFGLKKYYQDHLDELSAVLEGFDGGMKQQLVSGLSNSAKSMWISSMYETMQQSVLVVTHNLFQAQKLYDDLEALIGEDAVYLYPVNDLIASEIAVASPELRAQRLEALNHFVRKNKGVLISPVAGLKRLLPAYSLWEKSQLRFETGHTIDLENITAQLTAMGYIRESMVQGPGEFSIRGGIIDIYPLTEAKPVRIELFDDEVDSLRYFDSDTQRSEGMAESFTIGPARELLLYPEQFATAATRLEEKLAETLSKTGNKKMKETLSENIGADIENLKDNQFFDGMLKYSALFYEGDHNLLDYMPDNTFLVMDEMSRIQETAEKLDKEEAEWQTDLLQAGEWVRDLRLSMDWNSLHPFKNYQTLYFSLFVRHHHEVQPQNIMNMTCRAMQNFHGQIHVLKSECDRWKKSGHAVVMVAANEERAKRMSRVLEDYGIDGNLVSDDAEPVPGAIQIITGALSSGFELPALKLAIVTEAEVFANKSRKSSSKRKRKMTNAERLKDYNELKVGDYVVHIDHGIGKYIGIETLEVNGLHKDYLHIRYKGNDKLYVPVDNIDQVQKYVGSEGKEPKLYTLGGAEWKRVKNKTRASVQDIADDLIKLYAEREASKGYAFNKDGPLQHEFEASFPYQETEDQLQAIEEIKRDMESERPMDRLLCGDVGYGKTEVALRAAFKAIADGKQVAFLVPTTILAQQHFETADERFSEFAVNVGVLSRFRTRKEQKKTLDGLKAGTVDMAIGTHRILSKDVKFKDLGLLIVDEEQRFGVTHKEKIKQMKANVDVLTLTATPIPRTLHMSMLGVRDLSVIETPPENRFPVQTYVTEFNGALIRESIERELARDGQIYFLYNRVETIEQMAEHISALVPDARVAFAHGQMKENELEAVMLDFLDGAYDVLVSTTIIETGVDIPNVNTLIVNNADRMGLSQLYQLRGRVGRTNRVAYAYFTYQKDKVMNEVAEQRLQAIKEFTELGSGFKIAMRDLSIRGAGNLLGAQQHGFIDSVGFDLYSKMLKDAIEEKMDKKKQPEKQADTEAEESEAQTKEQNQPPKDTTDPVISIDADAYLPETYIQDSFQKIDMYKKFRAADGQDDLSELQDEMMDRFGEYPPEVDALFKVAELKVMASDLYIESVKQLKNIITIAFSEKGSGMIDRVNLFEVVSELGRNVGLGADGQKIKMTLRPKTKEAREQLDELLRALRKIYRGQFKKAKTG